jgi:glycosyltransferase involved in cell wall biosynthesis
MNTRTKVYLDPLCRVLYSTFYIDGIIREFGKENVSFSKKYFKELKRDNEPYFAYFAFVIVTPDNNQTRVAIDFQDRPVVTEFAYEWADIFAKININGDLTERRFLDKMVSIPPGFAIKLWERWEFAYYCFTNYLRYRSEPNFLWERYYKDYKDQKKREKLEVYLTQETDRFFLSNDKPYVFFISSLWIHQNCQDHTNLMRRKFIETCQKADCDFEGGFKAQENHPQYEEFKHLCFLKRYSTLDYIKKTKASAIVFNTPTVHNCHGWKLGEFLAMGKAIISTPLLNRLPEDLRHGENIHFISSIDEIESAIQLLLNDHGYRKKLEMGAKAYYEKFADPQRVIKRILEEPKFLEDSHA